jgi:hypothetical protein
MHRRSADSGIALWYAAGVVGGGALVLLARQDIHRAALLAGIVVGVLLLEGVA